MLKRHCLLPGLMFLGCCGWFIVATTAAEPPLVEPQDGVLLLVNGQTLSGKVTRVGDRYYVVLESGSINLPASEVLLHCRDLHEAYNRQRDASQGRVQDHLKLALWCLHNNLPDQARCELDAAAALDPDDPKIGMLRRRLELTPGPATSRPTTTNRPPVASEDLDRLMRGLPEGAVAQFATEVQPLLLNHCAAAACHGTEAKDRFHLLRAARGSAPTRRLTQRNLYQVLEQIDRDDPDHSLLLKAIREPHGPAHAPMFSNRQTAQYQLLVDWVREVTQSPDDNQVAKHVPDRPTSEPRDQQSASPGSAGASAAGEESGENLEALRAQWRQLEGDHEFRVTADGTILMSTDAGEPVGEHSDRPPPTNKPPIRGAAGMANRPKKNVQRGVVPRVTPRDPFDPELFNRQFHPPR